MSSWVLPEDEASLKFLPRDEHLYGFSPVWILVWSVRDDLVPDFSHKEQLIGFSPVWILTLLLRNDESLEDLPQNEQLNGFSPVWILIWPFRDSDYLRVSHKMNNWMVSRQCEF
jgi:hypothetical protein